MKAVRVLVVSLLGLLVLLAIVGLFLPSKVEVVRSIEIQSPKATTLVQLQQPGNLAKWIVPPGGQTQVETVAAKDGQAPIMRWQSEDPAVGQGELRVLSVSDSGASTETTFEAGGKTATEFKLESDAGTQTVSAIYVQEFGYDLFARYLGLAFDSIVGPALEARLQRLKRHTESLPQADFSNLQIERVQVLAERLAQLQASARPTASAISAALGKAYFEVLQFMRNTGLEQAGSPRSLIGGYDSEYRFTAAIPVTGPEVVSNGRVDVVTSFAGPALKVKHYGDYAKLSEVHTQINAYISAMGLQVAGAPWESYVSDPQITAPANVLTEVFYPLSD
ncbi:MAG: hypothetical protein AAF385_00715 [Pseudomonadota bacterium]